MQIGPITYDDESFAPLLADALSRDGAFMDRLREGWLDGSKRFDRRGEVLLGAQAAGRLMAVGGVTLDPYHPAPDLGRVRHFYVVGDARRHGIGRALLDELIAHGRAHFARLRLLTNNPAAARMYERGGFEPSSAPGETHRLIF